MILNVGDKAPNFSLPSQLGTTLSLESFKGYWFVIYFYPKDATPGCTTEANDFEGALAAFKALSVDVLGVSRDLLSAHAKFAQKQGLSFPLLSDAAGEMCENYGVWVEKNMYGRTYMGIERTTFLISPAGIIQYIWRKVKVKGHVEKVLETVRRLKKA